MATKCATWPKCVRTGVFEHTRKWLMKVLGRFGMRLWRASLGFNHHDGSLVAAGIAYYVALSFFPLMLVLLAGVSFAMRGPRGPGHERRYSKFIAAQISRRSRQQVSMLDAAKAMPDRRNNRLRRADGHRDRDLRAGRLRVRPHLASRA